MARPRTAVLITLALTPLTLATTLLASGCDSLSARAGGPRPSASHSTQPAAEVGGACQLLDYDDIAATIGVRFAVAAAAHQGETSTCAVQGLSAPYPDLVLAVTPTIADAAAFNATVRPAAGTQVDQLGLVAYTVPVAATATTGPGVEVCWLTGNARLIMMKYDLAPGAKPEDALAATPGVIAFAKRVDFTSS
jgi:hypothetical protein